MGGHPSKTNSPTQAKLDLGNVPMGMADLSVVGFGHNFGGASVTPISELSDVRVVGVRTGVHHGIAWDSQGRVYARGGNTFGPLGLGHFENNFKSEFTLVSHLNNKLKDEEIMDIQCGYYHTMLLTKSGKLFAWGDNLYGQLGNGRSGFETNEHTPSCVTPRNTDDKIIGIACGQKSTIYWTQAGRMFACGRNDTGQLGVGDLDQRETPEEIVGLQRPVEYVVCGGYHCVAVARDGNVFVWGNNDEGQLGGLYWNHEVTIPRRSDRLSEIEIAKVECGVSHTMVLERTRTGDHQLHVFGSNKFGQLGLGHQKTSRKLRSVVKFPNSAGPIKDIACFSHHNMAISASGKLFVWGMNDQGQSGEDTNGAPVTFPQVITIGRNQQNPVAFGRGLAGGMSLVVVGN